MLFRLSMIIKVLTTITTLNITGSVNWSNRVIPITTQRWRKVLTVRPQVKIWEDRYWGGGVEKAVSLLSVIKYFNGPNWIDAPAFLREKAKRSLFRNVIFCWQNETEDIVHRRSEPNIMTHDLRYIVDWQHTTSITPQTKFREDWWQLNCTMDSTCPYIHMPTLFPSDQLPN